jgi:hypothetical protein
MANTETMHDEDVAALVYDHGGEDLEQAWLEVLDREPEEKWLGLANSFFERHHVPLKAVSVELRDTEFYWEIEQLA